jgi:hypothetical protein
MEIFTRVNNLGLPINIFTYDNFYLWLSRYLNLFTYEQKNILFNL